MGFRGVWWQEASKVIGGVTNYYYFAPFMLQDAFLRNHTYLRLAVTDRCNLRCQYCMPAEGIDFLDRKQLLSYEEMLRLTGLFRANGLEKVRITGGEPLMRRDIKILLDGLVNQGLKVHLTTNGVLLESILDYLKALPLSGLNISLDSLRTDRFFQITRRDEFEIVWRNLQAALAIGLPTKINMVVMAGMNDDELFDFAALCQAHPLSVRFIEAMPFNAGDGNRAHYLSANKILARLLERFPDLYRADKDPHAAGWRYAHPGWAGHVGIIPAYSRSLCGQCNRLRLTPRGTLLHCLYTQEGLELLPLLRAGLEDEELEVLVRQYLQTKAVDGHEAERRNNNSLFASMTSIGG